MDFPGDHSPVYLDSPKGWVLYVSHAETRVRRLIVFVHGFNGKAVGTWLDFPARASQSDFWRDSDFLFVGYDSFRESVPGVSNRLRREIGRFYPKPLASALVAGGVLARADTVSPYDELVLVGHSLGGLVLRRALCDEAMAWEQNGSSGTPALLAGRLVLFSPATAGFRAAGFLGSLRASGFWGAVELYLRQSSAYSDLQPDSLFLSETRRRTEARAERPEMSALRAKILWANPEDVVIAERYDTDYVDDSVERATHSTVCKPRLNSYEDPWRFVETAMST